MQNTFGVILNFDITVRTVQDRITVMQGDFGSNRLEVRLMNGNNDFTPLDEDTIVMINFSRPDAQPVQAIIPLEDIVEGRFYYTLNKVEISNVGTVNFNVTVFEDDGKKSTTVADILVKKNINPFIYDGIEQDPREAPYINASGNWMEWDEVEEKFIDKGNPSRGQKGDQGVPGDIGANGESGAQGEKGDTGEQGTAGKDGKDGLNGATFTPTVDADSNISWSNDMSLPNPVTQNIKGLQGTQGIKGDKGDTGDRGEKGLDGANGTDGADGTDGKSAYLYAAESGYIGTEMQFSEDLSMVGEKINAPMEIVDLTTPTINLHLKANTVYKYGTLTSLTITDYDYSPFESRIFFTSGTTATSFTIPTSLYDNRIGEINILPNMRYIVSVCDEHIIVRAVG